MARHFYRRVWRKRRSAGFHIAEVTVKPRQGFARADNSQINSNTVRITEKILGSVHQFAAQSGSLAPWFHAEQTQVPAITANFDIDAASKAHRIFREQKSSLLHVLANTARVDAVALDEGQLDAERHVDQSREGFDIRALCETNPYVVPIRKRIGGRAHGNVLIQGSLSVEAGGGAQFFLDAEELVVLGDAVGAAGGTRFDLAGGCSNGEIGDESVFGFAGAMRDDGVVAGLAGHLDGINGFGDGNDLIEFDENGVGNSLLDPAREPRCVGDEEVISHQLDLFLG